ADRPSGTLVPRPVLPEDAGPFRPEGGLRPIGHTDPLEQVREMALDGLLADTEPASDLLVRLAVDHQPKDVALPRREVATAGWGVVTGGLQEDGGGPGRERRLASGGRADRGMELARLRVLQEVADGAGVQRVDDPVTVAERREDHDLR